MVPSSVIAVIAFASFIVSSWGYFMRIPKRLIFSLKFLYMGGSAAMLLAVVFLGVFEVQRVWASWVLLLLAIACCAATVRDLIATAALAQQQAQAEYERNRRGV
jgi:hypothetical protein